MKAGWQLTPLGDAFQTVTGSTPSKNNASFYGDFLPLVKPPELRDGPLHSVEDALSKEGATVARMAPPNTILVSCIGNLGKIAITSTPVAFNQQINAILPNAHLAYPQFMFYQTLSPQFKSQLIGLASGTTIAIVNKAKFNGIRIALPPLSEQRRIVAILDEAFAGLDAMRANAQKNVQNARELFERFLSTTFAQGGVGWFETTVGDQITLQRGFDITKEQQREGSVPVVSSGGIKSYHNAAMVKAPGVVIGRKGTLGKSFYLNEDFWPHDTTLWVKDFKGNHPMFVYYFFVSLKVHHLDSGAANPALNRNMVHPIKIVWPPSQLQPALADSFHRLRDEAERLQSLYSRKLAAIDELKQSILQKAFSGELTSSEAIAA